MSQMIREKRSTQGKGGRLAQLERAHDAIVSGGQRKKRSQPTTQIPDDTPNNPMAAEGEVEIETERPARKRAKKVALPRSSDDEMADTVPPVLKPSFQHATPDSRFGFRLSQPVQSQPAPASAHNLTQTPAYPRPRPAYHKNMQVVNNQSPRRPTPPAHTPTRRKAADDDNDGDTEDLEDEIQEFSNDERRQHHSPVFEDEEISPDEEDRIAQAALRRSVEPSKNHRHQTYSPRDDDNEIFPDDEEDEVAQEAVRQITKPSGNSRSGNSRRNKDGDDVEVARVTKDHQRDQGTAQKVPSSSEANHSSSDDILNSHRSRNRAVRPPDPSILQGNSHGATTSRVQQHKQPGKKSKPNERIIDPRMTISKTQRPKAIQNRGGNGRTRGTPHENDPSSTDSENNNPTPKSTQKRHSKTPYGAAAAKPTQLQYYPGQWTDVLNDAKMRFRLFISTENAFPTPGVGREAAENALADAMNAHKADGGTVEPGFYDLTPMTKLIYEDGSSYRGAMKSLARTLVPGFYDLIDSTAKDRAAKANAWKKDGKFLHMKGNDGKTLNFQHAAIKELCRQFYYQKSTAIAGKFPTSFQKTVPFPAVALASICIYNALETISAEAKNINLDAERYRPYYTEILQLLATINNHPTAGPQLSMVLQSWAKSNKDSVAPSEGQVHAPGGFEIYLD